MRLRNVKDAMGILKKSNYFIENPKEYKGRWNEVFKNSNEIMLEVGMGKGDFLIGMAKLYPEKNFIGIEKYESVLVRGSEKLENESLDNLRIINYDAKNLEEIFESEIDTIFLNFSDPWPKNRHYKRRLTYREFLNIYDKLFKGDSKIELKTDNDIFFESSLIELNNFGYIFDEVHLDLWSTEAVNVKTEYEIKFGNKGFKIKQLKAHKFKKVGNSK